MHAHLLILHALPFAEEEIWGSEPRLYKKAVKRGDISTLPRETPIFLDMLSLEQFSQLKSFCNAHALRRWLRILKWTFFEILKIPYTYSMQKKKGRDTLIFSLRPRS